MVFRIHRTNCFWSHNTGDQKLVSRQNVCCYSSWIKKLISGVKFILKIKILKFPPSCWIGWDTQGQSEGLILSLFLIIGFYTSVMNDLKNKTRNESIRNHISISSSFVGNPVLFLWKVSFLNDYIHYKYSVWRNFYNKCYL